MKPVLIFDLDDTLILQDAMTRKTVDFCTAFLTVDSDALWGVFKKTSQDIFENLTSYPYCKAIGISSQEGLWGDFGGASEHLNQLRKDIPRYRFQAWNRTLKHFGFPSEELAVRISEDFAALRGRRYYAFPDAREVLEALKSDFSLAILTNGAPELQWSKVHRCGLEDLFDSVTVSGDHNIGKPNREIFEIVFAKHPQTTQFVMIGNSLTSDIQGANNAGIPSIWFEQGDEPLESSAKPDASVRSLSEVPALIGSLLKVAR